MTLLQCGWRVTTYNIHYISHGYDIVEDSQLETLQATRHDYDWQKAINLSESFEKAQIL